LQDEMDEWRDENSTARVSERVCPASGGRKLTGIDRVTDRMEDLRFQILLSYLSCPSLLIIAL